MDREKSELIYKCPLGEATSTEGIRLMVRDSVFLDPRFVKE